MAQSTSWRSSVAWRTGIVALALAAAGMPSANARDATYAVLGERYHNDKAGARRETNEALAAARAARDPRAEMLALRNVLLASYEGDPVVDDAQLSLLCDRGDALAAQLQDDEVASELKQLRVELLSMSVLGTRRGLALVQEVESYARSHGAGQLLADALTWRGVFEYLAGRNAECLRDLLEAAGIYQALGARRLTSRTLAYAADILRAPHDASPDTLAEAKALIERALPLIDPDHDGIGLAKAYLALGAIAMRQGDLTTARSKLQHAVVIANDVRQVGFVGDVATSCHMQYARVLLALHESAPALEQAMQAAASMPDDLTPETRLLVHLTLARAHAQLHERREALAELAAASAAAPKPALPKHEVNYQQDASDTYSSLGDLVHANEALRAVLVAERRESLQEGSRQLKEMQVRFDVDLKDRENALLKVQASAEESRRLAMSVGLGLSVLLVVAGALGYRALLRATRAHNATLALLADNGREITRGLDRSAVIEAFELHLRRLAGVTLRAVWLADGNAPGVEGLARAWPAGEPDEPAVPAAIAAAASRREAIAATSRIAPGPAWRRVARRGRVQRVDAMAMPLLSGDFLVGVAAIGIDRGRLTPRQREIVRVTCVYAAVALHNSRTALQLAESLVEIEKQCTRDVLVHTARLVTVGSLAGGLVHEMAHPVGSMMLRTSSARDSLQTGDTHDTAEALDDIRQETRRLQQLITRLRNLCRADAPQLVEVTVGSLLDDAQTLFEPQLRFARVPYVRASGEADQTPVRVDVERVVLAIANIVANARDALETRATPRIEFRASLEPGFVALAIRDTGPGLTPEQRDRLFQPFFTTKPAGRGLGLGLALSLRSMESIGGRLSGGNHAEGGAVFTVWMPRAQTMATPAPVIECA